MSIVLWMAITTFGGEPYTTRSTAGAVAVQLTIDQPTVSLADRISVRITATGPTDVEIDEPVFHGRLDGLEVVKVDGFGPDPTGAFLSRGWTIELDPLRSGTISPPPIRIRVVPAGGSPAEVSLPLGTLTITTEAGITGSARELRDMPGETSIDNGTVATSRALRWSGLALLVGTSIYAVAWMLRRGRSPDPVDQTLLELDEVARGGVGGARDRRMAARKACDALRSYLEGRYVTPITRQSTVEYLGDQQNFVAMPSEGRERLATILPLADVERFAAEGPSEEELRRLLMLIRDFLNAERRP